SVDLGAIGSRARADDHFIVDTNIGVPVEVSQAQCSDLIRHPGVEFGTEGTLVDRVRHPDPGLVVPTHLSGYFLHEGIHHAIALMEWIQPERVAASGWIVRPTERAIYHPDRHHADRHAG